MAEGFQVESPRQNEAVKRARTFSLPGIELKSLQPFGHFAPNHAVCGCMPREVASIASLVDATSPTMYCPRGKGAPGRIKVRAPMRVQMAVLGAVLGLCLLTPNAGGTRCACAGGYSILDADCLDDILCTQCQNCHVPCCTGTSHWAQLASTSPWAARDGHSVGVGVLLLNHHLHRGHEPACPLSATGNR
jgi:hypothetical protein